MTIVYQSVAPAPCALACPAGIDVPRYLRHIARGEFEEAFRVIRESVPFPRVLGYACTHPCESKCNCNLVDGPIAIRALKRFVADRAEPIAVKPPAIATRLRVAIAGSGPAGLTAAYYLSVLGHSVTVFEARSKPGGMMRWGIPRHILPEPVLNAEIEAIKNAGFNLVTSACVRSLDELFREGYHAVLIAVGTERKVKTPTQEEIPGTGETLRQLGLQQDDAGRLEVDNTTLAAGREGVFGCGDVITGPAWIIDAIASGRRAAVSIDRYLGGTGDITETFSALEGELTPFIPSLTITRPTILKTPLAEVTLGSAAEQPLTEEAAVTEAGRCLRCDLPILADTDKCVGCLACVYICSLSKAAVFKRSASHIHVERIRGGADYKMSFDEGCNACGLCVRYCTHNALTRKKGPIACVPGKGPISDKMALVDFKKCHPERCDSGICAAALACSHKLLKQKAPHKIPMTDPLLCQGCGDCVRACPLKAIEIVRA